MNWNRLFKVLFWIQVGVNLVGALAPERGFDALWYHLPIGRMLVERGIWGTIPGGLLYYSGMPRLMDYGYGALLWLGRGMESPESLAKVMHWSMGVGSGLILRVMGGWSAAVLWYSSILVGWLSVSAYVDLARTLAVLTAFWFLGQKRPFQSAIMMGIAYSVKLLSGLEAVGLAIGWGWIQRDWRKALSYAATVAPFVLFWGGLNLWQGHPFFYPLGSFGIVSEHVGWQWSYLAGPMIGDGRYVLPEIALAAVWLTRQRWFAPAKIAIVGVACFGIVYRAGANVRYVPYLMGLESKQALMGEYLNFDYGDWYDLDGWVGTNLGDKRYLVIGVHNTYYLPGSKWEHESWANSGECFPYVLTQGEVTAKEHWQQVYLNEATKTRVFNDPDCVGLQ